MELEIIQVIQELSTAGGAERVAWELSRAFSRVGISNGVIASTLGVAVEGKTSIERVLPWLDRIPTRGAMRHVGRAVVVPLFTLAATFASLRHPRAVVLSHGDCLKGDAMVIHAVNAENIAQKRKAGDRRWMLNPLHFWVMLRDRWIIRGLRYRTYVAVSSRVATELHQYFGVPKERIRIIPNGIDTTLFRPDPIAGQVIRQEFGIPSNAKLLLFVGNEFSRKGLAHAIGALEQLPRDVWLLVVGSDNPTPYRKLANNARDRLIFAGPRLDVPAFFAASDALVLPTAYETFSLVCMEAMSTAVPVFATRVGGIEDYLEDGINGYGISTDPSDIANKITRAFSDNVLMNNLRNGARATAMRYGWDEIASKYVALLQEIQISKRMAA